MSTIIGSHFLINVDSITDALSNHTPLHQTFGDTGCHAFARSLDLCVQRARPFPFASLSASLPMSSQGRRLVRQDMCSLPKSYTHLFGMGVRTMAPQAALSGLMVQICTILAHIFLELLRSLREGRKSTERRIQSRQRWPERLSRLVQELQGHERQRAAGVGRRKRHG